jgi:hypothetical protein
MVAEIGGEVELLAPEVGGVGEGGGGSGEEDHHQQELV